MSVFRNTFVLLSLFLFFIASISSCTEKTTINAHYIYNTGWSKGLYQGFTIAKIKLIKPNVSVHNKNFNKYDLADYIIDSSFCFISTTINNKTKNVRKIYFDKKNDLVDWLYCQNIMTRKATIGTLNNDSWYIVLGVGGTIDYYVYIDNDGQSYLYSLGPTNW